jgi:hypothetical protein
MYDVSSYHRQQLELCRDEYWWLASRLGPLPPERIEAFFERVVTYLIPELERLQAKVERLEQNQDEDN